MATNDDKTTGAQGAQGSSTDKTSDKAAGAQGAQSSTTSAQTSAPAVNDGPVNLGTEKSETEKNEAAATPAGDQGKVDGDGAVDAPKDRSAIAEAGKVAAQRQGTSPVNGVTAIQTAGVGEDAVVVGINDRIEGVFKDSEAVSLVELSKDVVEEFYFPGTMRPAYRVLFRKGQVVPKAAIDALNARVDSIEYAGLGIDSTTAASGTQAPVAGVGVDSNMGGGTANTGQYVGQ